MMRLSQDLVNYILSWKPDLIQDPDEYHERMTNDPLKCFSQEYIDLSTEIMRDLAESSKRINADFEKFQAWARAEYEEKGCVEVDDAFIANVFRESMTQGDWDAAMHEGVSPIEGMKVVSEGFEIEFGPN
ncbi:hypothetical protein BAE44_0009820 [Dichanthelium oligosanthes]|uniref:Uncharacterized protein n=1 Tax=Dichanthelium oligosanthes TaxID=888268 RepID=A0A1E5VVK3_9POAL|nr:hypothetical protein BAE44_0009820 [Dichanthelium oligosanthes]